MSLKTFYIKKEDNGRVTFEPWSVCNKGALAITSCVYDKKGKSSGIRLCIPGEVGLHIYLYLLSYYGKDCLDKLEKFSLFDNNLREKLAAFCKANDVKTEDLIIED